MAKPASKPDWTVGNPDFATVTQEPSVAKKQAGWLPDERPPREFMNWLPFNMTEWINYFETTTDTLIGKGIDYDAVVGPTGTHADINEVIADMGVGLPATNIRVYVNTVLTVVSTQVIDKEGVQLEFHPSAVIAKGAALVIGLQINASRVKILGGRFTNFNEVGGKAIDILALGKNCHILNNSFTDSTEEIADAGVNNTKTGNIVEVA